MGKSKGKIVKNYILNISKCLVFGIITIGLNSCTDKDTFSPDTSILLAQSDNISFNINTEDGLNNFIKNEVGNEKIGVVEAYLDRTNDDSKSEYFVVRSKYEEDKIVKSVAIVLKKAKALSSNTDQPPGSIVLRSSCTMTCTPDMFCTGCDQRIIEICKTQICACNGSINDTGACNASISFGSPEQ